MFCVLIPLFVIAIVGYIITLISFILQTTFDGRPPTDIFQYLNLISYSEQLIVFWIFSDSRLCLNVTLSFFLQMERTYQYILLLRQRRMCYSMGKLIYTI